MLDYQENGKERGPALLDVIPCAKVDSTKGAATSYTCVEPITAAIKKGAVVNVWTQWFCPKGGKYEDLSIQSLLDGQVRNTVDITVEGRDRAVLPLAFEFELEGRSKRSERQLPRGVRQLDGFLFEVAQLVGGLHP